MPQPTVRDTALFKLPFWIYAATVGKVFPSPKSEDNLDEQVEEEEEAAAAAAATSAGEDIIDDSSDAAQRTPSTDSADDFELLDKSVEDLGAKQLPQQPQSKTTGSQAQRSSSNKAKKRSKKR